MSALDEASTPALLDVLAGPYRPWSCPRCGTDNARTEWVEVVDEIVKCHQCRRRTTRAFLVRLVTEDADLLDRVGTGVDA